MTYGRFDDLRMATGERVGDYRERLLMALEDQVERITIAPPHNYSDHDMTRESYCHTCGGWEPRWNTCIVCTDCGHVFVTAVNVKTWADYMERAGYEPVPLTQCPFCAGELQ